MAGEGPVGLDVCADSGEHGLVQSLPHTGRRIAVVAAALLMLAGCTAVNGPGPAAADAAPPTTVATPTATPGSVRPPSTPNSPRGPMVPAVARLAGLDGQRPGPGVTVATSDGIRWQGSTPGQSALVGTDSVQWFGADGSMVGCVSKRGCVGLEWDGTTAVVTKPGAARLVYSATGAFLGAYTAAGLPVKVPAPALPDAIRASGVDVADLVGDGTRRVPFAGGVTGDPHLITYGGTRVNSQITGAFYARTGDPNLTIQLRFGPMAYRGDLSMVVSAAFGMPGHRIVFADTRRLTIDGDTVTEGEEFRQISVPDGPELGYWALAGSRGGALALVWPDGRTVVATADPALGLTVVAHLPAVSGAGGLFGSAGDNGRLAARGGGTADAATAVRSWAVPAGDSLFGDVDSAVGTPPGLPSVPAPAVPQARQACESAGVTDPDDLQACVFDVAITGDDDYAEYHAELALPASLGIVPAAPWPLWPALVRGAVSAALPLPKDLLDVIVPAGQQRVYTVTLRHAGPLGLELQAECPAGGVEGPGLGAPALRVFDSAGAPVSARVGVCGPVTSAALAAGTYYLVLAGPTKGAAVRFRLRVSTP